MKNRTSTWMIVAALLALATSGAWAWVGYSPAIVNYQGRLLTATGAPMPGGNYTLLFSLYTAPSGGTPAWQRGYTNILVDSSGDFNAILGAAGAATTWTNGNNLQDTFTNASYLGIMVYATPSGPVSAPFEIVPRQKFVSAPYAMTANQADSADAIGGYWSFVDISHLNKSQVPSGGARMLGFGTNTAVFVPATASNWNPTDAGYETITFETNLVVKGKVLPANYGYAASYYITTDYIHAPQDNTGNPGTLSFSSQKLSILGGGMVQMTNSGTYKGNADGFIHVILPGPQAASYTLTATIGQQVNTLYTYSGNSARAIGFFCVPVSARDTFRITMTPLINGFDCYWRAVGKNAGISAQ